MTDKSMELKRFLEPDDARRLSAIEKHSAGMWSSGSRRHPFYTLHGELHSRNIVEIMWDILAPDHRGSDAAFAKLLPQPMLFCLLAAAWLHDVGMITSLTAAETDAIKKAAKSEADWVREQHHIRSYDYIMEQRAILELKDHEVQAVAAIARNHRKLPETYAGDSEELFASAVLRLADELDITRKRAPDALRGVLWNDMDEASRWQWVKHYCIADATHKHSESLDEAPHRISLSYKMRVVVPRPDLLDPLVDHVLHPIREALIGRERVGVVLQNKGLGVDIASFEAIPTCINETFPDQTDLAGRLAACLHRVQQIPLEMRDAFQEMHLPLPAVRMLEAQIGVLVDLLPSGSSLAKDILHLLDDYSSQMRRPIAQNDAEMIQGKAYLRVHEICKGLQGFTPGHVDDVCAAALRWVIMLWRLCCMSRGTTEERTSHLYHLLMWIPDQTCGIAEHIASSKEECDAARCIALRHLGKYGGPNTYKAVSDATKASSREVRLEAAKAMQRVWGPNSFISLANIVECDVDTAVRSAARETLAKIATAPTPAGTPLRKAASVLIIDNEQTFVSMLVDRLEPLGAKATKLPAENAIEAIQNNRYDVLVCDISYGYPCPAPLKCPRLEQ